MNKNAGRALVAALFVLAPAAVFAAPADLIVSPQDADNRDNDRIKRIRAEIRLIDSKLRAPGLADLDFRTLQELRTSLEQERKILEEQISIRRRVKRSPVLMNLLAGTTAQTPPKKSVWESGGWARFEGVLPCADCEGIRTELTLYNDGSKFVMEERYLGASAPARAFTSEGLWTTLRGHRDDPDATVFQLDYDKPGKERHFLRLGDDAVKLVDLDETKLRKTPNLVLKRVAP